MSHHSDGQGPRLTGDFFKEFINTGQKIQSDIDRILQVGPTHRFPQGKLTPDDKGEIRFSVGTNENKVVMDFGVPVQWIGFTAEEAMEIGKAIIKQAKKIIRGT